MKFTKLIVTVIMGACSTYTMANPTLYEDYTTKQVSKGENRVAASSATPSFARTIDHKEHAAVHDGYTTDASLLSKPFLPSGLGHDGGGPYLRRRTPGHIPLGGGDDDHHATTARILRGEKDVGMSVPPIEQSFFSPNSNTETVMEVAKIIQKVNYFSGGEVNIDVSDAVDIAMYAKLEPTFWNSKLDPWEKCILIIRLLDKYFFYVYALEKDLGHLVCGDSSPPTLSPTTATPTLGQSTDEPSPLLTASPTFIVSTWAKIIVNLQDSSNARVLEGVGRTLQDDDAQCTAALEKTFEVLIQSTKYTTDVTFPSITQDTTTGETTVVFAVSLGVQCNQSSQGCALKAVEEVSAAIEDSFSSGAFDNALATNLNGLTCPELTGLKLESVSADPICLEPNDCSGPDDITSCGAGEACLVTPDTTCPVFQCQQTPNPTATPTQSPSMKPTASPSSPPTQSPSIKPTSTPSSSPTQIPSTATPTKNPTGSPTTNEPTGSPTKNPTGSPTTNEPTGSPTKNPTGSPTTDEPTGSPTKNPTGSPTTDEPTGSPTKNPTGSPTTDEPTGSPTTEGPTKSPSKPPTNNPSSSPTLSPSTASPTNTCFASEAGGYRVNPCAMRRHLQTHDPVPSSELSHRALECRRRHLQPQDPVPSSELSHRVLQEDWRTWQCYPSGQTCDLFDAVRDYYLQDCDYNSTCEIGQVWGYPIGSWCVGSVVNMDQLFSYYAPGGLPNNITSDLCGWDTSSVTTMKYMFSYQMLFNGNLPWDVSHVKDMRAMIQGAESFNSDSISNWNTSSVMDMSYMFRDASSFNGNLSQWDTSSVTDMFYMFDGATSFNGNLLWDTSSVTSMVAMFRDASSFNGNLSQWDTSSVTSTIRMFDGASSFNSSSITNWNVSSVTNMASMFNGATDFAQDLCSWKYAPAVLKGPSVLYYGTYEMFTDSSGQPNDGSGGFNAAC